VKRDAGREVLVPFVVEIVTDIDVEAGRITVELPEGLLDLDLTDTEHRELDAAEAAESAAQERDGSAG
jgi:16S rRNA processing protein RimM